MTAVETLRKPSTGLKPDYVALAGECLNRRDTQKTQHGIETSTVTVSALCSQCRDTQKTQHGIETQSGSTLQLKQRLSRHSENPARD